MQNNFFILVIFFSFFVNSLSAEKYTVHRIFGKGQIIITNNKAYEGMSFDSKEMIHCDTDLIGMTVIDEKGKFTDFYGKIVSFKDMNIEDYKKLYQKYARTSLTKNVHMRTKGIEDEVQNFYIVYDSITINHPTIRPESQFYARWKTPDEKSFELSTSTDKTGIYITRDIFGDIKPQIIEVDIWTKNNIGSYKIKTIWVELLDIN